MNTSDSIALFESLTASRVTMQKSFLTSCYEMLLEITKDKIPMDSNAIFEEDSGNVSITMKKPMMLELQRNPEKTINQYVINRLSIISVESSQIDKKLVIRASNSSSYQFNLAIELCSDLDRNDYWSIKKVTLNRVIHYNVPTNKREVAYV